MGPLLDELTSLIDMVNAGNAGLSAVQRLVEFSEEAVGADGATFAEYGAGGGRVIAASGAATWAIGRLVDPADQHTAALLGQGRIIEAVIGDLPMDVAAYLSGQGIRSLLGARAELGGRLVGTLHTFFRSAGPATTEQRATVGFLAAAASHLYVDGRGLPIYAQDPSTTSLAEAIAVVGPDQSVRSWNPAAARITGWSAEATVGKPSPLPVPVAGQILDHRLPDGRWLQLLATELPGSDDRLITLRDVTETHRQEQARDLFVAVTSHELRTPVTVIKGYADTLVNHWEQLDEAGRRDAARRLGQRAGELARLLERLLGAVGDGAPPGAPVCVPFDLADALRTAAADLPAEARRRVRLELPDGLPKALGERASIAAVLSELVTNAIKYAGPDAPVEVTTVADARSVGFRVADRGIGLRPEHVERAFERFWQAEADDQRRFGGLGLGLYLVRKLLERQNGWVSLRPRERGGTVAEVRLPRADLGEA